MSNSKKPDVDDYVIESNYAANCPTGKDSTKRNSTATILDGDEPTIRLAVPGSDSLKTRYGSH